MELIELNQTYGTTEVGELPKDWNVATISELSNPVRGGSPRPAGDLRYFNGSFIPWLTVAALTNIPKSRITVTETATCLTEEGSLHSRILEKGTLIIANSGATLGVAKILGIRCCANDGIAALLRTCENRTMERNFWKSLWSLTLTRSVTGGNTTFAVAAPSRN